MSSIIDCIQICEEFVIDFILGIPHLKYCQIKISQSNGRIPFFPPNRVKILEQDCTTISSDRLFLNPEKWLELLTLWENLTFMRMYVQMPHVFFFAPQHFQVIQQTFESVPFLVERCLCPTYFSSNTNARRIHFNAYYQK
ncbi:hypothetical protein I4U23_020049 [Adineta vaga]|nr:hypothetical protein I4U23_020049 [Adineta vaga]